MAYNKKDADSYLVRIFESPNVSTAESRIADMVLYVYHCLEYIATVPEASKFPRDIIFVSIIDGCIKSATKGKLAAQIAQLMIQHLTSYMDIFQFKGLLPFNEIVDISTRTIYQSEEEHEKNPTATWIRTQLGILWTKLTSSDGERAGIPKKNGYYQTIAGDKRVLQGIVRYLVSDGRGEGLLMKILYHLPSVRDVPIAEALKIQEPIWTSLISPDAEPKTIPKIAAGSIYVLERLSLKNPAPAPLSHYALCIFFWVSLIGIQICVVTTGLRKALSCVENPRTIAKILRSFAWVLQNNTVSTDETELAPIVGLCKGLPANSAAIQYYLVTIILKLYMVAVGVPAKKVVLKMMGLVLESAKGDLKVLLATMMYPFCYCSIMRFKPYYDESSYADLLDELFRNATSCIEGRGPTFSAATSPSRTFHEPSALFEFLKNSLYEPKNLAEYYYSLMRLWKIDPSARTLLITFCATMILTDSLPRKLLYLRAFRRLHKKEMDNSGLTDLVPLIREAMKRSTNLALTKAIFDTFIPLVDSAEDCYTCMKEALGQMMTPESSYEAKILAIKVSTQFALYAKRTQDLFALQKIYRSALGLLPGSTLAEHLILLQIEEIARSSYGEFVAQYFFPFVLRNLTPAKTKEEVLRAAWTLHALHVFIKEDLLTFEVTYESMRVKFKAFESYLGSLVEGVGNVQFSVEEVLLVTNLLGLYGGFEEYVASTVKLIGQLSKPGFDESQKTAITVTIKERSHKIVETYRTMEKTLKIAWHQDILRESGKVISKVIPYVFSHGIEYTVTAPGDLSRIEQNRYKRQVADKAKMDLFESLAALSKKHAGKVHGLEVPIAAIISFELSNQIEDKAKVGLLSESETRAVAGKVPTFVKADYENVWVRAISQYLGDKSSETLRSALTIFQRISKAEIYKLRPVIFFLRDALVSKDPDTVSLAIKFLATFCNQGSEIFSYAVHEVFADKSALQNIITRTGIETAQNLVMIHRQIVTELLSRGDSKRVQEVTTNFAEAISGPSVSVAKLTTILRGIKKTLKEAYTAKSLPFDLRKSFEKSIKSQMKKTVRAFLKAAHLGGKIRGENGKMSAEWVKAAFVLYQHATGDY